MEKLDTRVAHLVPFSMRILDPESEVKNYVTSGDHGIIFGIRFAIGIWCQNHDLDCVSSETPQASNPY